MPTRSSRAGVGGQRPGEEGLGDQAGVAGVATERARCAERRAHAEVVVVGERAVGDLEADDTAVRRGQSRRAAAVAADAAGDEPSRDRRRRSTGRAAGAMLEVPRVRMHAVGRHDAGGAHARLVLVGHADDHRAGVAQPPEAAGLRRRDQLERCAVARPAPRQRVHVLDRDRHAVQRSVGRGGQHLAASSANTTGVELSAGSRSAEPRQRGVEQLAGLEVARSNGRGLRPQPEILRVSHRSGALLGSIGSNGNRTVSSCSSAAELPS